MDSPTWRLTTGFFSVHADQNMSIPIVVRLSLECYKISRYMTGLLHEGKFNVRDLLEPAIFDSLPWAYVMCNWAQILIGDRH